MFSRKKDVLHLNHLMALLLRMRVIMLPKLLNDFFSVDYCEGTQSDSEGATWHTDPSLPPPAGGHADDKHWCAQGGKVVWKPQ